MSDAPTGPACGSNEPSSSSDLGEENRGENAPPTPAAPGSPGPLSLELEVMENAVQGLAENAAQQIPAHMNAMIQQFMQGGDPPQLPQGLPAQDPSQWAFHSSIWDPLASTDWERAPYPPACLLRINRDIKEFHKNPPFGIWISPREDISLVDFLIIGPQDTPYDGGFFEFVLRFPPEYPLRPPRVKLLTTGNGAVRFNPNLYANGKVCLSLIGTWQGPPWTAALGLTSLIISIQSLMNENPYYNEPGFEHKEQRGNEVESYNKKIKHETLRVAVIEAVKKATTKTSRMPQIFRETVIRRFHEDYDKYLAWAESMVPDEKKTIQDFLGGSIIVNATSMVKDLKALRVLVTEKSFPFLKNQEDRPEATPGGDAPSAPRRDSPPPPGRDRGCGEGPSTELNAGGEAASSLSTDPGSGGSRTGRLNNGWVDPYSNEEPELMESQFYVTDIDDDCEMDDYEEDEAEAEGGADEEGSIR